jgi:hypothetical protein
MLNGRNFVIGSMLIDIDTFFSAMINLPVMGSSHAAHICGQQ